MKPDIFIISLGCPRNLVDSEVLVGKLKEKGFDISYKFKKNSVAIVNTCGFIEDAKVESIDTILELAKLKKEGKLQGLVVTGCLSQRYSKDIMKEIKEIDGVFGSSTFTAIPGYINHIVSGKKIVFVDKEPNFLYHHHMPRTTLTPKHSVYVKIQEGCMNFCSYCVIPKIRGPFRSRNIDSVLKEITSLKKSGAKEINIVGQDTTLYGVDIYKKKKLDTLLKNASQIIKTGWLRLLYTHPAHYTKELINVIKHEKTICKYLDLPIQHISDRILRKMNRHVTKKGIITLIQNLRKNIPNLGIRTSIIVGFPGETDKDFKELRDFIEEIKFERLGVFMYSREEGTKAFDFPNQIPDEEKKKRQDHIMELQKSISLDNNRAYFGKIVKVLIEEKDKSQKDQYLGRTEHDAPEVDGVVYVYSKKKLKKGDFVNAKINGTMEYDLFGGAI